VNYRNAQPCATSRRAPGAEDLGELASAWIGKVS